MEINSSQGCAAQRPTTTMANKENVYVYVRAEDRESLSPFLISKFLEQTIGQFEAKHTKEGLLIKISEKNINKIHGATINNRKLEVKVNEYLNTSKGTIFFPEFNYIDEEEILQELENQGVVGITRFLRKRKEGDTRRSEKGTEEGLINTGVYLLNFNRATKPLHINICHERVEVKTYYPNPMKCTRCHSFGHKKKDCRRKQPLCGNCDGIFHDKCNNQPKCHNCGDDHSSKSRKCPVYLRERNIIKYATDNQVSYKEARSRQQTHTNISTFAETLMKDERITALETKLANLQDLNNQLIKKIAELQPQTTPLPTNTEEIEKTDTLSHQRTTKTKSTAKTPSQDHLNRFRKNLAEINSYEDMDIFEPDNAAEEETNIHQRSRSIPPASKKSKIAESALPKQGKSNV